MQSSGGISGSTTDPSCAAGVTATTAAGFPSSHAAIFRAVGATTTVTTGGAIRRGGPRYGCPRLGAGPGARSATCSTTAAAPTAAGSSSSIPARSPVAFRAIRPCTTPALCGPSPPRPSDHGGRPSITGSAGAAAVAPPTGTTRSGGPSIAARRRRRPWSRRRSTGRVSDPTRTTGGAATSYAARGTGPLRTFGGRLTSGGASARTQVASSTAGRVTGAAAAPDAALSTAPSPRVVFSAPTGRGTRTGGRASPSGGATGAPYRYNSVGIRGRIFTLALPVPVAVALLPDAPLDHPPVAFVLGVRVRMPLMARVVAGVLVDVTPRSVLRGLVRSMVVLWVLLVMWLPPRAPLMLIRVAMQPSL